jgi:signal transduction histidine kinase
MIAPLSEWSLTRRLTWSTGLWLAAGLIMAWLFVADVVSREMERAFDARLGSLLDALAAATTLDATGRPVLLRAISEPRFDQPLSGYYWQIDEAGAVRATSRSLWDQSLPTGASGHPGIRHADLVGPRGEALRLIERDIALPRSDGVLHLQVAGSRRETASEISRMQSLLGGGFALLAAGLVLVTALQVSAALAPLRRLRRTVAELRTGQSTAFELPAPPEVRPLVLEITALVAQNRATVERARAHVGNLAHALRTNLSVMRNALDSGDIAEAGRQMIRAEQLVHHHLGRARTAALAGATARAVPVRQVADDLATAMERLFAERGIDIEVTGEATLLARCEREDLTEMLGNLMENACKWARRQVHVRVEASGSRICVRIEDDGPGLAPTEIALARSRGMRLDEAVPGSGLGLAIVTDLAVLYGGELELSPVGRSGPGLRASLWLPLARSGDAVCGSAADRRDSPERHGER